MIKVRILLGDGKKDIACDSWEDVYKEWLNAPSNSLFYVEIDGDFEEFTQEDIEERQQAELLEQLNEESQEDASEKDMY